MILPLTRRVVFASRNERLDGIFVSRWKPRVWLRLPFGCRVVRGTAPKADQSPTQQESADG